MAKGNLFLSQARGKVGSVVFYRQDGEQVTRVYTNQVSNPRTSAQNLQRAIFYTVQRYAAGAKYIIEQGQENVAKKRLARQAFLKQALNRLRTAYESGENLVLNIKGNPYLQPVPISLTNGTLAEVPTSFVKFDEDNFSRAAITPLSGENLSTMTLREFFELVPALSLGKQLTIVWLSQEDRQNNETTPTIQGLNYKTKFQYSEIVFTNDEALLDAPAFINDPEGNAEKVINPAVIAPTWGGNAPFPTFTSVGTLALDSNVGERPVAFAAIVSDYTNNIWSRSTSTLSVNPDVNTDNYAVTETYGASATDSSASALYLDQALTGSEEGVTERTAQAVISYLSNGVTATQSAVLTDNQQETTFVVPNGSTNVKLSILGTKMEGDSNAIVISRMSGGTIDEPISGGTLSVTNSSNRYQINGALSADAPAGSYNNIWSVRHADYAPGNSSTFTQYRVVVTLEPQGREQTFN